MYVYTGICVSEFVLMSCLLCVTVATLWCSLACCDHMLDCSNKLPAFLSLCAIVMYVLTLYVRLYIQYIYTGYWILAGC